MVVRQFSFEASRKGRVVINCGQMRMALRFETSGASERIVAQWSWQETARVIAQYKKQYVRPSISAASSAPETPKN